MAKQKECPVYAHTMPDSRSPGSNSMSINIYPTTKHKIGEKLLKVKVNLSIMKSNSSSSFEKSTKTVLDKLAVKNAQHGC